MKVLFANFPLNKQFNKHFQMNGHADVLLTLITDQSFSGFSAIDFLSTVLNGVQMVTGNRVIYTSYCVLVITLLWG